MYSLYSDVIVLSTLQLLKVFYFFLGSGVNSITHLGTRTLF